jgi:hypothetical protein
VRLALLMSASTVGATEYPKRLQSCTMEGSQPAEAVL